MIKKFISKLRIYYIMVANQWNANNRTFTPTAIKHNRGGIGLSKALLWILYRFDFLFVREFLQCIHLEIEPLLRCGYRR